MHLDLSFTNLDEETIVDLISLAKDSLRLSSIHLSLKSPSKVILDF